MSAYQVVAADDFDRSLFRAYDIRGVAFESLSEDLVYSIGLAVGSQAQSEQQSKVIVGRDGRLSGPRLSRALVQGLLQSGCDVIDIGQVTTPMLYFATHTLETQTGVMLTGSHNPADYNGLKIVIAGTTLSEQSIQHLVARITECQFCQGQGQLQEHPVLKEYMSRIVSDIQLERPLKIVVDCGNGIAGMMAPQLFTELGCDVTQLFCDVDGNFPNHHPDPSVVENLNDLIKEVKNTKADVGLAFDGDADRLGVVTNKGEIIWPDRQLMLYAIHVLQELPGSEIIYDVKCSKHLTAVIEQHGGVPLMWKTGHSLVKAKLKETGAPLAGEMSGHTFFKHRWYGFDDGVYTAARLLEIIAKQTKTVSEIFSELPDSINTPELKCPIAETEKFTYMQALQQQAHFSDAELITIDGLRADFKDGWGLVRASNTTPCLVLRFEADNEAALKRIQELFRKQMLSVDKNLELPF